MTWSALGRVNLIGEHLDYNGGRVLPIAIDRRIDVTISTRSHRRVRVRSADWDSAEFAVDATAADVPGWARYPAAALCAFARQTGWSTGGLDIDITSRLPAGAGLSSSAALLCALVSALDEVAGTRSSRTDLADVALSAERDFVGVPCGPMDPYAVMLAQQDQALSLDCRTLGSAQVPFDLGAAELVLLVVDTGSRHALADGAYAARRAECEAAADQLGVEWLVDADLSRVRALRDETLRRRAHHVVTERARVEAVVTLLRAGRPETIGGFLTQSHQSLSEDFEVSCVELDTAVDAALAGGALGARMTGAGFGGSAIVLCRRADSTTIIARIGTAFEDAGLAAVEVWPTAASSGTRRVDGRGSVAR